MPSSSTRTSPRRSGGRTHHRGFRDARPGRSRLGARRSSRRPAQRPTARGRGVEFPHVALDDADVVELGNTIVRAMATPGHARHITLVIADRRRGDEEPWLVFTGDSLLVGDVGRPDLHRAATRNPRPAAARLDRAPARAAGHGVLVYPSHYGGSVCGRRLSANRSRRSATSAPITRRSRTVTRRASRSPTRRRPAVPADQAAIVAANRRPRPVEAGARFTSGFARTRGSSACSSS